MAVPSSGALRPGRVVADKATVETVPGQSVDRGLPGARAAHMPHSAPMAHVGDAAVAAADPRPARYRSWAARLAAPLAAALLVAAAPTAAAAGTKTTTTTSTTAPAPPAASVPVSGVPTPVPPIPTVTPDITAGQDPALLLQRALALSSVGASRAPLEASLAQAQQVLDAQTVTANQAAAAATAATARAGAADVQARSATASAASLQGALREAALRLYTGGASTIVPTNPGTTADSITDAAAYEDTVLSPDGILAQRKAAAKAARAAAAARASEQAAALRFSDQARAAVAAASSATAQITQQLSVLDTGTARLVSAERAAVSAQAGTALLSGSALEFTPAAALPAPLPTTSVALAWAFSELGKTYVWGGTGPDVFDCSGLTQYSWAQAGVAIPRVAADQDSWTVPVPLSQLLPGDLVFYGTIDIHHVGMYIGDGLMINAPHTGDVVRVSPIWWSDLAGFGRVHAAGVPVPTRQLPAVTHPAPPVVVPTAGAVPSQTAPPPGYIAPPGATAPIATTTTVPGASTSVPAPSTSLPSGSTTTAPGGSVDSGTTTTSSTSTSLPATSSTTAPLGGLLGG